MARLGQVKQWLNSLFPENVAEGYNVIGRGVDRFARQAFPMLYPSEMARIASLPPLQRQALIGQGAMDLVQPAMMVGPKAVGFAGMRQFSNMADRMPRAEISDAGVRLNPLNVQQTIWAGNQKIPNVFSAENKTLADVLEHPNLWEMYPDIAKKRGELYINPSGNAEGVWLSPDEMQRGLNWQVYARNPKEAKEILLHEIQHAIQEKEGWARGANLEGGKGKYHRSAGEIEARDTAERMALTDAERASQMPYASQDIPLNEWIVSKQGGPALQKLDLTQFKVGDLHSVGRNVGQITAIDPKKGMVEISQTHPVTGKIVKTWEWPNVLGPKVAISTQTGISQRFANQMQDVVNPQLGRILKK